MPAAVKAVPFRRVCVPDGSPVTFLAHVVFGEGGGGSGSGSGGGGGGGGGGSSDADRAVPWRSVTRGVVAVAVSVPVAVAAAAASAVGVCRSSSLSHRRRKHAAIRALCGPGRFLM